MASYGRYINQQFQTAVAQYAQASAPARQVLAPDYESERAAKDAAAKQSRAAGLAMGAGSTILTGGMGLTDEATTKSKKLFGE